MWGSVLRNPARLSHIKEFTMNKFARIVRQNAKSLAVAPAATLLVLGTKVHAALPAGATEAIEDYKDDVVAGMGLMIAAGIAIFAVRKLGQKMGWF